MAQNVFFVDLHHPGGHDSEIDRLFGDIPSDTKRIFLMGDIFHYWVNDVQFIEETYASFLNQLERLACSGMQLFFIEGNRDFLAPQYLDDLPWIEVLPNPSLIDLGGRVVYVGHGDELCWNDYAYQFYKSVIRSQPMRYLADRLPSTIKRKLVRRMSDTSKVLVAKKSAQTLAVPQRAYEEIIQAGVDVIVHGHLHQSYQREFRIGGRTGQIYCFGWKDEKRNMIYFEG